jgi:hypothetical protein
MANARWAIYENTGGPLAERGYAWAVIEYFGQPMERFVARATTEADAKMIMDSLNRTNP